MDMNEKCRSLLFEFLGKPEVTAHQGLQTQLCAQALDNVGVRPVEAPVAAFLCTAVGVISRQSLRLVDPSSGARLDLVVQVLAKIDGTVKSWVELWCEPAEQTCRTVKFDGIAHAVPRRIRLTRQNLFDGSMGQRWTRHSRPLEVAQERLNTQGFFQHMLVAQTQQLERAVCA